VLGLVLVLVLAPGLRLQVAALATPPEFESEEEQSNRVSRERRHTEELRVLPPEKATIKVMTPPGAVQHQIPASALLLLLLLLLPLLLLLLLLLLPICVSSLTRFPLFSSVLLGTSGSTSAPSGDAVATRPRGVALVPPCRQGFVA